MQHFAAEHKQRQHGQERQTGGQNGPAQGLVNALVDDVRELLPPHQLQVLADAVEHDDGVVVRITDQGQDSRDDGQRNFLVQQGKCAHRNQGVVEDGNHGRNTIYPFEAKCQINQHSGQGV